MLDAQENRRRVVPMARDGWRFVLPLVGATLVCFVLLLPWVALVCLVLAFGVGWFFRDPERRVPKAPGLVLAPADGRVACVDELEVEVADGERVRLRRVGIVLSIFNAHIQRAPSYCLVRSVQYNPGKFLNAFNDKSSKENENNTIWMHGEAGVLGVKQIAGLVARRVVCWCRPGEHLVSGQRLGLIRFGSRTEAYFPLEARVRVSVGDKVKAGLSVLAEWPDAENPAAASETPSAP